MVSRIHADHVVIRTGCTPYLVAARSLDNVIAAIDTSAAKRVHGCSTISTAASASNAIAPNNLACATRACGRHVIEFIMRSSAYVSRIKGCFMGDTTLLQSTWSHGPMQLHACFTRVIIMTRYCVWRKPESTYRHVAHLVDREPDAS